MLSAPDYLSPSSISTFVQCPLKYKYSRIDGIVEPPTEATILGNFVHSILEGFYRRSPDERSVATARQIASAEWVKYEHDVTGILRNNTTNIRQFRWKAWWCVENLMSMEKAMEMSFGGIETELDHEIDGVRVKGFVDRWAEVGNKIVIGDYKTGKTPKEQWQDDKFDQLLIYAIILSETVGKDIGELELLYLKDGVRLRKTPTQEDVARLKAKIREVRNSIDERCRSGVFETKKSNLCSWCHFKTICPEWS